MEPLHTTLTHSFPLFCFLENTTCSGHTKTHIRIVENNQKRKNCFCHGSWQEYLCKTSGHGWITELALLISIIFEVLEPGAACHSLWGVVFYCTVLHISMTINKHQLSYFPEATSHSCLVTVECWDTMGEQKVPIKVTYNCSFAQYIKNTESSSNKNQEIKIIII